MGELDSLNFRRHIFDEVNGYVGITDVENEILDTSIYQRLRRIQNLGCASLVFPGASHSRFSHSLGTVYVMDKFARSLGLTNSKELQLLRLVALLHDVGHLPFSHTLEPCLKDEDEHSEIGQNIIAKEPISGILSKYKIDPEEAIAVLRKSLGAKYSVLIDSDLDVDKVDYLVRDAHHTGVVYGNIDVDRLSRTIYFDSEGRLCVQYKGKQALENFLLARYYMYSTVYQHSTVASFELMIRLIFLELVKEGRFLTPSDALSKGISYFVGYNDDSLLRAMLDYDGKNDFLRKLIEMYFKREPLKLVHECPRLARQKMSSNYHILILLNSKNKLLQELATASDVPIEWIFFDETKPIHLVSEEEAGIRIQTDEKSDKTVPIAQDETSIVSNLRDIERTCLRMYTRDEYKKSLYNAFNERYSS